MVCKEDVIRWFKDLSGFKRIDFMCGLLNMCVPFELRFFGTCVEDLGKKDFFFLRDAEHRANNTAEITKLTNLSDDVTRSKLIVSLALLDSSNHVCANVIFKTLTDCEKFANVSHLDDKITDEILLLFTIALHHPAFTFDQKSSLGDHFKTVKSMFTASPCEDHKLDVKLNEQSSDSLGGKYNAPASINSQPGGTVVVRTTIKNLELKRVNRRKPERKSDFRIQVTWSSGETTEVTKNYQELYEFSLKIQQLLPDDKRSPRQERNFLPAPGQLAGYKTSNDASDDAAARLFELIHQFLLRMPPLLLDCDQVTWFFHGQSGHGSSTQWPPITSTSPSRHSSQGTNLGSPRTSVPQSCSVPTPRADESTQDVGRVKSLTIYNSQMDRGGKHSTQDTSKGKPAFVSKEVPVVPVAPSGVALLPSPLTSPQPSPVSSPFASPPQSGTSSRAASPWTQRSGGEAECNVLKQFFRQDKFKRCRGKLNSCTPDELRALGDDDLLREGVPVAAITELRKILETFTRTPPNGLTLHSLERSCTTSCTTPSCVTTPISSTGMPSFLASNSEVNPLLPQVYPTPDFQARPIVYPVMTQPPPIIPQTQATPNFSVSGGIGGALAPNLMVPGLLHHPHSQLPRHILQYHPSQQQHHHQQFQCPQAQQQHLHQQRVTSADSSPSCSQNSSPPESPSLDSRNNYDSSCSEETDKDKDADKAKYCEQGRMQKNGSYKKVSDGSANKLTATTTNKSRTEEDHSYNAGASGAVSAQQPGEVNQGPPLRPTGLPDLPAVTASGSGMNSAVFQRSRLNTVSTQYSPPGTAVHAFKPQHIPMVSPIRNTPSSTIIIENSQFMKPLPTGVVPSVSNVHNRWEGMNGSCPPPLNGSNSQHPNPTVYVIPATQVSSQAENPTCRTSNSVVSSSIVVTCASHHPQITTVNMSNIRSHSKTSHVDEAHKVNNNNLNSSMPPTTACLPCHGSDPSLPAIPTYLPPTPISYQSMPPNPVAPTTVTYTTSAFVPANSGQSANSQPHNPASQGQVPHNHGALPSVSTGCSNTCVCSCSCTTPPSNLAYSPGFLPLQMGSAMFTGFPGGFLQPHNANGFISPTLPNFPFAGSHLAAASAIPNGITPELIYSGTQFPMLQQNGSHHSGQATPGFISGPAPGVSFHGNYNTSNQLPIKGKTTSCYNCGVAGHRGLDCKELTMEEMAKPGQFRLNYTPTSKPMESTE